MESVLKHKDYSANEAIIGCQNNLMSLDQAGEDTTYTIRSVETEDEEIKGFLFTLGCYEGEDITVISILSDDIVINIKDARYSINKELARAIMV